MPALLEPTDLDVEENEFLDVGWKWLRAEYQRIMEIGAEHGFRLGMVYVPYRFAFEWPEGQFDRPQRELRALAEQPEGFFIDPLPRLRQAKEDVFLRNDPIHMNEAGFAIVAHVIFEELTRQQSMPGANQEDERK